MNFHENTNIAIKMKPGIQTTHCMTSDILLLVVFVKINFHILRDNYYNLNHLVIASASQVVALLFRFHCSLLFSHTAAL